MRINKNKRKSMKIHERIKILVRTAKRHFLGGPNVGITYGKPKLCLFYLMYVSYLHNCFVIARLLRDTKMLFWLMYVRFSHNFHPVTSLLIISNMCFLLMNIRFSHNLHSIISVLILSNMCFSAYVHKVFAHVPFRNFLTSCFKHVVFAYVRKVFAHAPFRNFLTYCFEKIVFSYVRKVFAQCT